MTAGITKSYDEMMASSLSKEISGKDSLGYDIDGDNDDNFSYYSSCSSSDFSSCFDSDEESLIEMEERIKEFSRVGSTPALAAMVFNTDDFKLSIPTKKQMNDDSSFTSGKKSVASEIILTKSLEASLSSFSLRRSNSDQFIQTVSNTADAADPNATKCDETKPSAFLKEILKQEDITFPTVTEESTQSLMIEMTEENFSSYGTAIADAVRIGNLDAVKAHVQSGQSLQCCNRFGESVVHIACRRGHTEVLQYMLEETNVSPCIQDDIGRTPLHELAWTSIPNFDMVKLILDHSPDLLYVKDSRGFTPLSYVGRNNWDAWCDFLDSNRQSLTPKNF